uniref:Mono-ADP ribosylhydrolase 1 n=1 Tax=Sphenodon punctatus TaxID=8508 RepID=A0A8D0L4F9_SPHPU
MPGWVLMSLPSRRLPEALGQLLRVWGSPPRVLGRGVDSGRAPLCWGPVARGIRSWAAAPPLGMAAKVDLTTSTDWKEAKSFLKGLNNKQRREHYFTKDFIKLKQIPTWKELAKSARVKQPEESAFPKDNRLNEKISLLRGDITKLEVDAIVNAGE